MFVFLWFEHFDVIYGPRQFNTDELVEALRSRLCVSDNSCTSGHEKRNTMMKESRHKPSRHAVFLLHKEMEEKNTCYIIQIIIINSNITTTTTRT